MKLRLTRLGFKAALFYGVVLFVHFAASYSNLFFLLLCFATSLGAVAIVATLRNLRGADARVHPVEPVPAGLAPVVHADVSGAPIAARVEVRLENRVRFGPGLARGIYPVRDVRLVSTWPFGLFRAVRELDPIEAVVVHPAPVRPGAEGEGTGAGEDGAVSRDGMAQPSSLREYRPGDPLRRIRWRAMARRGEPVVAIWEAGCGEGYEFLLDRRAGDEDFERMLGALAGLAQAAREEKVPLTLHAQDHGETYGPGHRSWNDLWRYLAGVRALPVDAAAPPPVGTHVVRLTA